MQEEWRPIPGWEKQYEASSYGRIRRSCGGRGTTIGRILQPINYPTGYQGVKLRHHGRVLQTYVHRLVLSAFHGPRSRQWQSNHKNGDKTNNSLVNLEYVTSSENQLHAYRVLHRPVVAMKGMSNPRAKLTNEDVSAIRKAYQRGITTQQSIAITYSVDQTLISAIVRGVIWKPDQ